MDIRANITAINDTIYKAREMSPLARADITLLAASKSQTIEVIEQTILAGITCFGENRVQEAESKWVELKQKYPHIKLHLIGALQTNKVKQALELFDVVQTLDRISLAEAIASMNFNGKQFYIQINTGEEPQKSGVLPQDADNFIYYCINELKLPVVGLMCVPPADQPTAPHFALLRSIAVGSNLQNLSMGMSGDFETAIRMGSSLIRIGSALFGERG